MSCLKIQLTVPWLNLTMPNQTVKNGLKAKKINLNWSFSRKTTNRTFMYLLAPFTLQNFEKNSTLMRMCHFKDQNDPFVMNIFFDTNRYYYFHLPIGPFYCAKLKKKFLQRIQSYDNAQFLGPKWSNCPKCFFGKLLISFSSTD